MWFVYEGPAVLVVKGANKLDYYVFFCLLFQTTNVDVVSKFVRLDNLNRESVVSHKNGVFMV